VDQTPTDPAATTSPTPAAASTYDVVLLVEEALDAGDAARVRSLHEGIDEPVRYHVLLPVEDAAAGVEAALGGLSTGDMLATPIPRQPVLAPEDLEAVQDAVDERGEEALRASLAALEASGARVVGHTVSGPPIDELAAAIAEVDGREAIVVTRPHVVAEFFHVDWSAQARRRLGVPVLHLVEHETFDEQAGEGEGVTGV
jgi:hypothetical protein